MAKREAIGKKLRFEIFKRDNFTCKYCGRKSPDITLEIDHIIPVSKGGTNDINNLVTSCRDCNRGKGANEIEKTHFEDDELECSIDYFEAYIQFKTRFCITEEQRRVLKNQYEKYGYSETSIAIDIALERYYDGSYISFNNMLSKIGGILYNRRQQGYGNI